MLASNQNVGYQQYWFGAGGYCYTINWAPKPGGFAYNGKDPFPPVRSWWFQLLKPARSLLTSVCASPLIQFLCWRDHVGFLKKKKKNLYYWCDAENNWGACALHSWEIISCTTTVFVTILYQKLWVWFGFLYLILIYSLILTFSCECDANVALLLLPWFSDPEYTHPGLSQNNLSLKEVIITSFEILVQMPCEFWGCVKSWLCL